LRRVGLTVLAALALPAAQAHADVKTVSRVETYAISGASGQALMDAMDRKGPRHGFMARAIAQTRYSVDWELGWTASGGACRLSAANVTLSVAYRYPALAGPASPALARKWASFIKGVKKHEQTHGRIARKMVDEAYRSALKVRVPRDPRCTAAKREVTRIVQATYAHYEAEQQRFDALEHQPGGAVDRLVSNLIRRN
jgi:predicted secreted Zn-dependent protease